MAQMLRWYLMVLVLMTAGYATTRSTELAPRQGPPVDPVWKAKPAADARYAQYAPNSGWAVIALYTVGVVNLILRYAPSPWNVDRTFTLPTVLAPGLLDSINVRITATEDESAGTDPPGGIQQITTDAQHRYVGTTVFDLIYEGRQAAGQVYMDAGNPDGGGTRRIRRVIRFTMTPTRNLPLVQPGRNDAIH